VREDFLDEKKALDEVEPYIFGIPQMVERDSFDRAEASASSVHEDCMAVRREWSRWYFGDKPDMEEVLRWKGLSNDEKFQEGILKLRRGAQYEPTKDDLTAGKFKSSLKEVDALSTHIDEASVHLKLSDIYQRYAAFCYDDVVMKIATEANKRSYTVLQVVSSATVVPLLYLDNEMQMREMLHRSDKVLSNISSLESGNNDSVTLNAFDGSVATCSNLSRRMSEMVRSIDERADSSIMKEDVIRDARKLLFGQHEKVCNRNQAVK
jgi:hypothetical protein